MIRLVYYLLDTSCCAPVPELTGAASGVMITAIVVSVWTSGAPCTWAPGTEDVFIVVCIDDAPYTFLPERVGLVSALDAGENGDDSVEAVGDLDLDLVLCLIPCQPSRSRSVKGMSSGVFGCMPGA